MNWRAAMRLSLDCAEIGGGAYQGRAGEAMARFKQVQAGLSVAPIRLAGGSAERGRQGLSTPSRTEVRLSAARPRDWCVRLPPDCGVGAAPRHRRGESSTYLGISPWLETPPDCRVNNRERQICGARSLTVRAEPRALRALISHLPASAGFSTG